MWVKINEQEYEGRAHEEDFKTRNKAVATSVK
jgi:hypothetical protein